MYPLLIKNGKLEIPRIKWRFFIAGKVIGESSRTKCLVEFPGVATATTTPEGNSNFISWFINPIKKKKNNYS